MKKIIVTLLVTTLAVPAYAGFQSELVDEGLYFVWYERGRWTAGSVLDTARKARRKLEAKSHDFCLGEGYNYMRFLTFGEISRDENLRLAWELAAGDESADSCKISDGSGYFGILSKTHKSLRFLAVSENYAEGFVPCLPDAVTAVRRER